MTVGDLQGCSLHPGGGFVVQVSLSDPTIGGGSLTYVYNYTGTSPLFHIQNMPRGVPLYVRGAARSTVGVGAFSSVVVTTLSPASAPAAPIIDVFLVPCSIAVAVTAVDVNNCNLVQTPYRVEISNTTNFQTGTVLNYGPQLASSFLITPAASGIEYYVRARVENYLGISPYSATASIFFRCVVFVICATSGRQHLLPLLLFSYEYLTYSFDIRAWFPDSICARESMRCNGDDSRGWILWMWGEPDVVHINLEHGQHVWNISEHYANHFRNLCAHRLAPVCRCVHSRLCDCRNCDNTSKLRLDCSSP